MNSTQNPTQISSRILKAISLLLIAVLLGSSGCKKEEDKKTPAGGCNVKLLSDFTVNVPTTWYKDTVYVLRGINSVDATLTIQPGTIVKFKSDATLNTTNGDIQAVGTVAEPIIFTAFTDDSYCGDNNGDGAATTATKGFWGGIALKANTPSNFTYCKFLYAGANTANGANLNEALEIRDASNGSTIDHCTFAHTSGGTDPAYAAVHFGVDVQGVVFTNNIIYDNGAPVVFETLTSASVVGISNTFHNPSNTSEKNVQQALMLKANQSFNANTALNVTEIPYAFYYLSVVRIVGGVQVTVADNVIIKFEDGQQVDMNSAGNSGFIKGNGVLFTSIKDDTGGDSNGDGNATAPATGDWDGIYDSNLPGSNKWAQWSEIQYDAH